MFPDWQPIVTAPKDGTKILIFERENGDAGTVRVASWRSDTIPQGWTGSERAPTHWLPLPTPPGDLLLQPGPPAASPPLSDPAEARIGL